MTHDISRFLEQPRKHYSATLLQQGRPVLDSDFNEGSALVEEEQRRLALDVVGPSGSPDQGFALGEPFAVSGSSALVFTDQTPPLNVGDALVPADIAINGANTKLYPVSLRSGSGYLGGHRLLLGHAEHIAFQRDFLQFRASDHPNVNPGSPAFRYLYYLSSWDQFVTATEDDEISEPMLRGPDTAVRLRQQRRVQIFGSLGSDVETADEAFTALVTQLEADNATFDAKSGELKSKGRLQLAFAQGPSADACAPCDPTRRAYEGDENVTLRILLTSATTYVWAKDNAAPLFRIKLTGLGPQTVPPAVPPPVTEIVVEMLTPPSSERHLPLKNRVVEIIPFGSILQGGDLNERATHPHAKKTAAEIGVFARVFASFDPTTQSFKLDPSAPGLVDALRALIHQWDPKHPEAGHLNVDDDATVSRYFYLRLWHTAPGSTPIELPTSNDPNGPALGDTGVVPLFRAPGRRGDFWIAALRTETPDLIVPYDLGTETGGVSPHGPHRFIAPIALVAGNGTIVQTISDARRRIRRVRGGCFTVTVGDGMSSIGDFRTIQEAVNALPTSGGRIAVRPGRYPGAVRIFNRSNIVIEGCGDASVVSTAGTTSTLPVFDIQGSTGVSVSGFSIQSVEQLAVRVRDSVEVTLNELAIQAGGYSGATFVAGLVRSTTVSLIDISLGTTVTASSLVLEAHQRPALRIMDSDLVTVAGVFASGTKASQLIAREALLSVSSSTLVKIADATLKTFGQIGVALKGNGSREVTLEHLSIDTAAREAPGTFTQSLPAVDIEGGERIVLASSDLRAEATASDWAVVVARGNDVALRSNRIECLEHCYDSPVSPDGDCAQSRPLAWGGIQLRGGSRRMVVQGNHVSGGVGHGITLGSVLWFSDRSPIDDPAEALASGNGQRQGAGRAQLLEDSLNAFFIGTDLGEGFSDADSGDEFNPLDEGPLTDVSIVDNRIEQMLSSGISVLTVLGLLPNDGDLMELHRARIEGNIITGNLRSLSSALPVLEVLPFPESQQGTGLDIPVLPMGGIVLGAASDGIDIRHNTITHNGVFQKQVAICGIFILNGDAISITENRIKNNGAVIDALTELTPGVRAGIAVLLAGSGDAGSLGELDAILDNATIPDAEGSSLRVVGNTVIQNEGRALLAVATGPLCVNSNYLASLGFHGAETPVDRFAIGDVVALLNLGAPWETFNIQSITLDKNPAVSPPAPYPPGQEQGFVAYDTPTQISRYLLNDVPGNTHFFVGEGGRTLFNNNQITYDWTVKRLPHPAAPLSFFPIALLGMDHVAMSGNQFGFRLDLSGVSSPLPPLDTSPEMTEPVLAQVFATAGTVDVSRNRIASGIGEVGLSCVTLAEMMSSITLNHFTHDTLHYNNVDANVPQVTLNQVLASRNTSPFNHGHLLENFLRVGFLRLLRRRPGGVG